MTQRQCHLRGAIYASSLVCALAVPSLAEAGLEEKFGDPGLNYFSLGLIIVVILIVCYGLVAIHDIPARIAESRHHPHADAIHAAGWVSLFTLHVLWPFLWIWAMMYKPDRGWGFSHGMPDQSAANGDLQRRVADLETKLSSVPLAPEAVTEEPAIATVAIKAKEAKTKEPKTKTGKEAQWR